VRRAHHPLSADHLQMVRNAHPTLRSRRAVTADGRWRSCRVRSANPRCRPVPSTAALALL